MANWTPHVRKLGSGERERLAFAKSIIKEGRFDEAHEEIEKALQHN
jgi:hypothetical protein